MRILGIGGITGGIVVRVRSKLDVLAKSPRAILLAVIFLLYLLPALCGFPTWPGGTTSSHLTGLNVWDGMTFSDNFRPVRQFMVNELWSARLPLWLPTPILGLPLIEVYEYQILNPLEWLTYLGGDLWWTIVLCGYLFVGALGVYAVCKRIGLDELPAIGGALSYVAAGHVVLFYAVPTWSAVIPTIPWIFYCAAFIVSHPSSGRHFFGLWISLALLLVSGQPQIILCTSYFVTFFIAVVALFNRLLPDGYRSTIRLLPDGYKSTIRGILLLGTAGALALAIAAPQIAPFTDFVLSSDAFTGHEFTIVRPGVSAINFLNLIFPFSMGPTPYANWTHDVLIRSTPSEDFPITFYCTGGFLALIGLSASYRRGPFRAEQAAYALTAVFSLATIATYGMLDWPVWPFGFVNLARYSCPVLAVLLSVMFGIGLQYLNGFRRLEVWIAGLITSIGVATIAFIVITNFHGDAVKSFPILAHVSFLSAISLVAAALIFWMALNPNPRTQIAALIIFLADATFQIRYGFTLHIDIFRMAPFICLVAGALLHHFRPTRIFIPVIAATTIIVAGWGYHAATQVVMRPAPEIPSASLMKGHRIAASLEALRPEVNMDYGVKVLGSRSPINFNRLQYFLFGPGSDLPKNRDQAVPSIKDWRGFSDAPRDQYNALSWSTYCNYRSRFNAISADMLIGYRGGTIDKLLTYPGCESGIRPADLGNDRFSAYIDDNALPRAYFARSCQGISHYDPQRLLANVAALRNSPLIERGEANLPCEGNSASPPVALQVVDISPTVVEISTTNLPNGLVVLNDQFFKSWNAYTDGNPADILRVNSVMRGVIIPAETKVLRFSYEPKLFIPLMVSLLSLIAGLFISIILSGSRRQFGVNVIGSPAQLRRTKVQPH